ncbi:cupin domain-containing protein [Microbacterium sp.]|uniref:cupin domain-containing protein n=1 Tax=Microbacterium sp. TaxID=51671 RepID=UPI003A914EC5
MDAENTAPTPRIVGDAFAASAAAAGSAWRLEPSERGLDANVIVLPAGDEIQAHIGPELDVLIVVLDGSGTLETAVDPLPLSPGTMVWLPARSQRRFVAGDDGLRYFSVHQRKPGLSIRSRLG